MDLYYYTTTETMKYILSGGNIYATNMKYMNDSEEYTNGLREIREYIINKNVQNDEFVKAAKLKLTDAVYKRRMESEVNSFSISFTTARDLLSQWSMYAKESGVSLKMEFEDNKDYEFLAYDSNEEGAPKPDYHTRPKEVYYFTKDVLKKEDYETLGDAIINEMKERFRDQNMQDYSDNIEMLWLWMTPFVKRADFGAEREYRLIFSFDNIECFTPRVDFRNDKNVLKPYLDISMTGGWPVTEIIVGPGFNQDAVFNGISYFLSKAKILTPTISMMEMGKRMEEYLKDMVVASGKKTQKVLTEWKKLYKDFTGNTAEDKNAVVRLYQKFAFFLRDKGENNIYREYIKNNYLSSDGIALRKSKIPYIF